VNVTPETLKKKSKISEGGEETGPHPQRKKMEYIAVSHVAELLGEERWPQERGGNAPASKTIPSY